MKRILILAACAIGMASCSKRNDVAPPHKPVVTISKDLAAQGDHTVQTSTEFGAKNVALLEFVITTEKAITMKKLPATFSGTLQLSSIEDPIRLFNQFGVPLSSVPVSDSSVIDLAPEGGISIPAGTTHVAMLVNTKPIGTASFHNGDHISVAITEDNVNSIEVDGLTAKDFAGSVQGPIVTFSE